MERNGRGGAAHEQNDDGDQYKHEHSLFRVLENFMFAWLDTVMFGGDVRGEGCECGW